MAATLTGAIAVAAGWEWGALLLVYFAANVLISRVGAGRKSKRLEGMIAKSGARDHVQVFANGVVFTLAALAHILAGTPLALVAGSSALAASTSDTWATELGALSHQRPRHILNGTHVATGESGGVTLLGTSAALAGAVFVSTCAVTLGWPSSVWIASVVGGFSGSTLDSLLGATVQVKYWCARCDIVTESRIHSCGAQSMHRSGLRWIDNDVVNLISTVAAAGIAVFIAAMLR